MFSSAFVGTLGAETAPRRKKIRRHLERRASQFRNVSSKIAAGSPAHVRQLLGDFSLGLLAYLMVLLRWVDVALFKRTLMGFHPVGLSDDPPIFRSTFPPSYFIHPDALLEKGGAYTDRLMGRRRPPSKAAVEAMQAAVDKDLRSGFADGPYTRQQVDQILGPGGWLPLWRFVICQGEENKWRGIDDGHDNECNAAHASSRRVHTSEAAGACVPPFPALEA